VLFRSRDAFGVLVKGKSLAEANTLQLALRAEGIETHVVPESELPALPTTKFLNRLEAQPEALTIYDPLGRSIPVAWGHIMLIGAGNVRMPNFNRIRTERSVRRISPTGHSYMDTEVEYKTREEDEPQLLLEIILTKGVGRFSVNATTAPPLLFAYLGDRRTRDPGQNFALLVRDLMSYAPHASLNRGAYALRETGEVFAYPSKNAFFEEIVWLLWWLALAERQGGQ